MSDIFLFVFICICISLYSLLRFSGPVKITKLIEIIGYPTDHDKRIELIKKKCSAIHIHTQVRQENERKVHELPKRSR